MALKLKKLDDSMKGALADFIADWKDEAIIPSTLQKYSLGFEGFIDHLHTMETDPPRLMSPSTMWFLMDDDEILGAYEVRHFLNSGLLKYGGHIGYGVAPKHRGNGYAAKMIEMSMPMLKQLNLDRVLICCVDDNIPSAKTILKAGGVLENEVEIIRNNQPKIGQRYWLEVK
ncbi:MAG: GNAT family N-acetyltransferase [Oscillospiraceae bacterium]|nr:GNAT family N-acetyltransferase [Oscillospiraceae bacterium]